MKKIVGLAVCFLFFLVNVNIPLQRSLVIEDGESGRIIANLGLPHNKTFKLEYTHSIHRSTVLESYHVLDNGKIRQFELMYEDTAIGMPAHAEQGEIFEMKAGKYVIRNMKREFDNITMRTAQVVGTHTLIIGEQKVDLSLLIKPGSLIKVKAERLSLLQYWKGANMNGATI